MLPDPWLERWLPSLRESAGSRSVLEIGCGIGDDTATLVDAGLSVVAFDISKAAVAATRLRVPKATVVHRDVRDPFPVGAGAAGAIVASLSLHYFPWRETVDLVARIRSTLCPAGLFLCRVNSTEDRNFGAVGHPVIEPNYYLVDGQAKRFFDGNDVDRLFETGWQTLSRTHASTGKYVRTKNLWEIAVRRADA